jgi:hypothetical protein
MSKNRNAPGLTSKARRDVLVRLGRFTAVSAPAVTMLLAAQTKPASAVSSQNCSAIAQSDKTKFS